MKAIRRARIIIVAGGDEGLLLAKRLLRMEASQVIAVPHNGAARSICRSSGADLCVVVPNVAIFDRIPLTIEDAPGRDSGIPSLLIAGVVTPYLRKQSRRGGYRGVVTASVPARMLYRAISGALQQRRVTRLVRTAVAHTMFASRIAPIWPDFAKRACGLIPRCPARHAVTTKR